MRVFTLQKRQVIPLSIQKTWEFFSDPGNLAKITPENLGFRILQGNQDSSIYPGKIIAYKVSPLFHMPLTWVTEITHVEKPYAFTDKQLAGPYKLWSHKHFFKALGKKTVMTDIVDYALPGGWLSPLIHSILVKPRLEQIFSYREKKLVEILGRWAYIEIRPLHKPVPGCAKQKVYEQPQ